MIDAHQHFWAPARGDYGWMEGAGAAPIRRDFLPRDFTFRELGIAQTVLVQAAPSAEETEYMLGLADATDWIAKVVGWIDFEDRSHARHLARFAKHRKFAGVRPMIQDIPDTGWMHRADVQWAYDAIIDHDLTFDALGYPIHLDAFLKLFLKYPKLRVVVDHCMKPVIRDNGYDEWAPKIAAIAKETQAYCKLSGLATEAKPGWTIETLRPYAGHVIASFGPDRVMWGSDWPVLTLNGDYTGWLAAARELANDSPAIFDSAARVFYRI